MDKKLEQLEATLSDVSIFNVKAKREETVSLLAELLPDMESFLAETQRLKDALAVSQQEQRVSSGRRSC